MMGVESNQPEFVPKDMDELNLYEELGGIRLEEELAMEQVLDIVYNKDIKWSEYNEPQIIGSLFDNAIAGEVQYIDPSTGKVAYRVIDWENAILDESPRWDYSTSEFFGEIIPQSILTIHKDYYETTGKIISEEDWKQIIQTNKGYTNNGYYHNYGYGGFDWDFGYQQYYEDFYKAPLTNRTLYNQYNANVLDFVYLATDVDTHKKTVKHYVRKPRKEEIRGGKIKKDRNGHYKKIEKEVKTYVKRWRRGKWVIGTDLVYDYGLAYDQIRQDGVAHAPFRVVRLQTKSPIQIMRPNLDEIQKNWIQIQNLKASSYGNILSIDADRIFNAVVGGRQLDKPELVKMIGLSSRFIYSSSQAGDPRGGSQSPPITVVPGGMGNMYVELIQDMQIHTQAIYDHTGLNPVALGSQPEKTETLGQTEISVSASANAIGGLYRAVSNIKEGSAYITLLQLQSIINNDKDNPYKQLFGSKVYKTMQKIAKEDIRRMSISIQDMPTQIEINEINNFIGIALAGGKNGNAGITISQAAMLKSMIQEGKPYKLIALKLKNFQDQETEKMNKTQMEMIKAQGQEVQQQQQQKAKAEMQQTQLEGQIDMAKIKVEKDAELRNDFAKEQGIEKLTSQNLQQPMAQQ